MTNSVKGMGEYDLKRNAEFHLDTWMKGGDIKCSDCMKAGNKKTGLERKGSWG